MTELNMKDKQLEFKIEEDALTIKIGTDILKHAVEIGRMYGCGEIEITNSSQFLEGFVRELSREDEDGSTLIHRAFDSAVSEMLENGERGVDLLDDD